MERPRIGLTVGDPAGIGPEITEQALRDPRVTQVCTPVLYDSRSELVQMGIADAKGGMSSYQAVCRATHDALEGRLDALTTSPINKTSWNLAGLKWPGHTELLADLTGATDVAMMFYTESLRVVIATVHIPLSLVSDNLTQARIERTVELAHAELPLFGCLSPRLAIAGVNPHAGEKGLIGREEVEIIEPAVQSLRSRGINIEGPLPADTIFVRAVKGEFDAVIACYHDQGLIPAKLVGFGKSVNVTLGLPIVRTSVDHGTAYDIAGKGIADHSSLVEAIILAARLASRRTGLES
tara:strand:+ start:37 stop:921 length:885 start_codon:yes stop_codon:yes gene_type:complete